MPTLRRPTVTLHYDDLGPREAPTVLLSHSLLCDRTMFSHLAADLARTHRVLNLDTRGHGLSSPATRGWSLEDACDDLAAVLDHAEVARATLIGLSMGAMLAMRAAVFHPKRVEALCLLDTSAEPEAPFHRAQYMAMAGAFLAVGVPVSLEARIKPLMFSDGFMARAPETVEGFFASLRGWRREGLFQAVQAVAMRGDFSGELGHITAPTMVLVGDQDRATPMFRAQRIVDGVRHASLDVVRQAGHLSTVEQPELTTQAVRAFLERVAEGV
jgi:3-oxoadipate enol-lactonase